MAESYKVIIYSNAEKDLQEIVKYIEENVGYQTAEKIRSSFVAKIGGLTKRPTSHGLFKTGQDQNFRKIVVKKAWNLIFKIAEEDKTVYVIRILHVKRGGSFIRKALK